MDFTSILSVVAKALPAVGAIIGGPVGGLVGQGIAMAAARIAGTEDPIEIGKALTADPVLQRQLATQAGELEKIQLVEETKRLQAVNTTMQAEITSGDKYVRRWRPTFGYAVCIAWLSMSLAPLYVAIADSAGAAATLVISYGNMTAIWATALAILGVGVVSRSGDKKTAASAAAGMAPSTILSTIFGALTKK